MNPLTEKLIRASFVNCSRREASQLTLPADLSDLRWDRLDYLGWIERFISVQEKPCRLPDRQGPSVVFGLTAIPARRWQGHMC